MHGPAGYSYSFAEVITAAYPSELLLAPTWNNDFAYPMGESASLETMVLQVGVLRQ